MFVFQRYEKRNFGWFKTYYIGQMKIHVIKSFYTWIDKIRFEKLRYTQKKTNTILGRGRKRYVPNRNFAKKIKLILGFLG